MANKDYYKILEVEKGASEDEIKKAYKKLAKKYHPDISKEADAETRFKEVNEAAGVLLDNQKRKQYDTYGTAGGASGFGGSGAGGFNPNDFGINIDDIFEQFGFGSSGFSDFGGGRSSSRRNRRDNSLYEEVVITLDDVYFGTKKEFTIDREISCDSCDGKGAVKSSDVVKCSNCDGNGAVIENQRSILGVIRTQKVCPKCNGAGEEIKNPCSKCKGLGSNSKKEKIEVKVPKGVESGVTLRMSGKGNYDRDSKSYGDLYLKVFVEKNNNYEVEGSDLYKEIEINFVQAILGDEIEFKHFNKTLSLKIPEGTQAGTMLRLKGKGLPYFNYEQQGDLYVRVNVSIPKKTSKEQKKILMDYAKTFNDKGFFDRLKNLF